MLVALGSVGFAVILATNGAAIRTPLFAATLLAELLKVVAVTHLFTADGAVWFDRARREQRSAGR